MKQTTDGTHLWWSSRSGWHLCTVTRGQQVSLVGLHPAVPAALRQSTRRNLNPEDVFSVSSCRFWQESSSSDTYPLPHIASKYCWCTHQVCCSNKGEAFVRVSWWHTISCACDSAVHLQMHKTQPNGVKGRKFENILHVTCEMCCVHRLTPCSDVMVLCLAAQLPGWVLDAGDLVLPIPMRDRCVVWSHVRCSWDVVMWRVGTMGSSGYPVVQVGVPMNSWLCA